MPEPKHHPATVMFTDMVGYQDAVRQDESLAKHLLDKQKSIIRQAVSAHRGRDLGGNLAAGGETGLKGWIKGSSGKIQTKLPSSESFVLFENALDATRCAAEIQRVLREYDREAPSDKDIYLRIGIHVGDVSDKEGEVSGEAAAVASRVAPLAEPGGICVSEKVYREVRDKIDFRMVRLGKHDLKNIDLPLEVYKLMLNVESQAPGGPYVFDPRRLAILPLANMSADPNDEYFADGMTEELISTTSSIIGLIVIARTSVMRYKGLTKGIEEIGKELSVGTVLEGSVRRAGNRLRITVQLIDVQSQGHLWAQSYDRELDDIFKVQDDIAGKVAQALRVKIVSVQEPTRSHSENVEAHTLYLKGRFLWNKRNKEGVLEAVKLFQEAIKIDPAYARAYAGLADAYNIAAFYGFMDIAQGHSKAEETVTKALALDDTLAEAHASLGNLLGVDLRCQEAQRELQRAIELNPGYASAHHWHSLCLRDMGRVKDAMEEIEKAHELDPLSPVITLVMGGMRRDRGRLDEAIAIFDKLISDEPTFVGSYLARAYCFAFKNMKDKASADLESYRNLGGDEAVYKLLVAAHTLWFGERERATSIIEQIIPMVGKLPFGDADIAGCYAILGNRDEFFKWIEKAMCNKRVDVGFLRYSPVYDNVRNDPRFPEIFAKLGLTYPSEQTA